MTTWRLKEPVPLTAPEIDMAHAVGVFVAPHVYTAVRLKELSPAAMISWTSPAQRPEDAEPHPATPWADEVPSLLLWGRDAWSESEEGHPELNQVQELLAFAGDHRGLVLCTCQQGVSRSTATALAILLARLGPGHEAEAVERLLAIRPQAAPNMLIVRHAARALGVPVQPLIDAVVPLHESGRRAASFWVKGV